MEIFKRPLNLDQSQVCISNGLEARALQKKPFKSASIFYPWITAYPFILVALNVPEIRNCKLKRESYDREMGTVGNIAVGE